MGSSELILQPGFFVTRDVLERIPENGQWVRVCLLSTYYMLSPELLDACGRVFFSTVAEAEITTVHSLGVRT